MPSEVIRGHDVNVRVSWGNDESDGTVQVVTQAATREGVEDPTARIVRIVNDWLSDAGEPTIDLAKLKAAMPYEPGFDGWWAMLDNWSDCNRLVKVLQRARDRAFGPPA